MFETSTIELSASAYHNNLRFIRKIMQPGVRLCSVVKGNAYGHGYKEFIQLALDSGVKCFAVHAAEEAFYIKQHIPGNYELFVMGAIENDAVAWAIANGVEFAVFDYARLETTLQHAKKLNQKAKVHIEMETGMRRTGFPHTEIPALCAFLKKHAEHIIFQGLFTHYAGAESQATDFRVSNQIMNFNLSLELFASEGMKPVYHHSACSAALINYPETQGNMVRIGILQYGFWPSRETQIRYSGDTENTPDFLKRIIRWTTKVMTVKDVQKGCFIGYGTAYLAHQNMRLAVIPVGYAHGYSRNLSNIGNVLIHGKICPIIGTVNMNSLTVDITHAGNVEKGSEVVLIGKQSGKAISVNSFSEASNLLNYELLTRLPVTIPRILIK